MNNNQPPPEKQHRKYIYPPRIGAGRDGTSDSYKYGRSTPYDYCSCEVGKDHDEEKQECCSLKNHGWEGRCQPHQDEGMDWEGKVTIMNQEWVVRLIKFGQAKIPEHGFFIFENPDLVPFINSLLSKDRQQLGVEVERGKAELLFKLVKKALTRKNGSYTEEGLFMYNAVIDEMKAILEENK